MLYEIKVPEAGFSITEATVIKWHKNIGERIQEGETIVTVETDKVAVEIPAQYTGVLMEIRHEAGETVPVGSVLGIIAEEGHEQVVTVGEPGEKVEGSHVAVAARSDVEDKIKTGHRTGSISASGSGKGRKVSPLARAIARREGIDLSEISVGSGPGGRIVKEDVVRLLHKRKTAQPEIRKATEKIEDVEKVEFSGWRKVIADRMTSSVRNVPQASTLVGVDVTDLARLIASTREHLNKPKITYLPFVMKAMQAGVDVTPEVNAYCYEDGFVLQKELNIGVAVDLGEKLLVPVVKGVREKSILELAEEIQELAKKARADKLEYEEVQGGTITITNLGPYEMYAATPIILQPQTAIIAMGTVREEPSVMNGSIEIRKRMILTGVFDHRVVSGGPAARFLKELRTHLEDLNTLILKMK